MKSITLIIRTIIQPILLFVKNLYEKFNQIFHISKTLSKGHMPNAKCEKEFLSSSLRYSLSTYSFVVVIESSSSFVSNYNFLDIETLMKIIFTIKSLILHSMWAISISLVIIAYGIVFFKKYNGFKSPALIVGNTFYTLGYCIPIHSLILSKLTPDMLMSYFSVDVFNQPSLILIIASGTTNIFILLALLFWGYLFFTMCRIACFLPSHFLTKVTS